MKILALELSTPRGSLAWRDGDVASFVREWPNDRKNSAAFFENLDVIAKKFGSPDIIVVGLGPGSYAGTRIAISAAIGLQISSGARLIGFPSICAIESAEADYCVIGDARRKSFFFARISGNELREGPELFGKEGLKNKLASLRNDTPVFCSESLSQFSEAMVRYPSAQLLARLAQDPNRNFRLPPLEPMYLREPLCYHGKPRDSTDNRTMNTSADRCWAEIDQSALRHNAKVVRERIGSAELLAVVKANGYGHGMVGIALALAEDAQLFGVANLREATELRAALLHPIIILGPALPEERATIAERGFIPSISTLEEAQDFDRVAPGARLPINFKVDTGMGRMGVPEGEAFEVFKKVSELPHIKIHSVSTHLPVSDEDEEYTRDELLRFGQIVKQLRAAASGDFKAHVLQSSGVLAFADPLFDMVRAGMVLYGISPLPEFQKLFKPVMTWKTRIALVRDMPKGSSISYGCTFITPRKMRIATLSVGYADGYPRHLSNRDAAVLVRGQRCALLGRVTMDLMMIDVSKIDSVQAGDEALLMGRDGNEEVSCAELAEKAGTITWEITTRIGSRVRRIYL